MKLSVSNLAWGQEYDDEMYRYMKMKGIQGIEIAPTRVLGENPYKKLKEAADFADKMKQEFGLEISSMQSIWYGRSEKIFESVKQRQILTEYTKMAFEFAHVINCHNIVFGCPRNRCINSKDDWKIAIDFFEKLGELAEQEDTVLALEANPVIYNTNFMNTTEEVVKMVRTINMPSVMINYDVGAVRCNNEKILDVIDFMPLVNHVHISEPCLVKISYDLMHKELISALKKNGYSKYISIEMKNLEDIEMVKECISMLKRLLDEENEI